MLTTKVVAAIDFGTHATGFAWAVINETNKDAKRRRIITNTQWASQPVAYPKNLTALLFDEEGNVVGWGHDARKQFHAKRQSNLVFVSGFKMRLLGTTDPETELSLMSGDAASKTPAHKDPATLIGLYLEKIYENAVSEIAK
ncbi:hypothetical protein, partial [Micromonospora sp. NPDC049274]|uniref:hypothetical protein n=1 Tax=Micromonospora sp. NPDC049274 TaxID=3154829 RepID=UPI0034262E0C